MWLLSFCFSSYHLDCAALFQKIITDSDLTDSGVCRIAPASAGSANYIPHFPSTKAFTVRSHLRASSWLIPAVLLDMLVPVLTHRSKEAICPEHRPCGYLSHTKH